MKGTSKNDISSTTVPFFSMGRETYKVSVHDLFVANRERLVSTIRSVTSDSSSDRSKSIIFLHGGQSFERYDTDHEPLFRQESYFWYLAGVKEPDVSMAIDVVTGKTTLFIPKLPAEYATIMGRIRQPNEWKEHYCVNDVQYTEDIHTVLDSMLNGGKNGDRRTHLLLLKGRNSDSGNWYEPPSDVVEKFSSRIDTTTLFPILAEQRVIKSITELHLLQHITEATSFAHAYAMRNIQPQMMEYQGK